VDDRLEQEMSGTAPPADPRRHYELCLREGGGRIVLRYKEKGITLDEDRMAWQADGRKAEQRYADIDSIRLATGHIPKSGSIGECRIAFRSGLVLAITSATEWGYSDDARNGTYIGFVRDLHQRLATGDRGRIRFEAGNTPGRQMFGRIALVLGGALFVLLPLALLLVTGRLEALGIAAAGGFFLWPVLILIRKNEPRTYSPDRLDEDLFPVANGGSTADRSP
jgi:hypothetical protein